MFIAKVQLFHIFANIIINLCRLEYYYLTFANRIEKKEDELPHHWGNSSSETLKKTILCYMCNN